MGKCLVSPSWASWHSEVWGIRLWIQSHTLILKATRLMVLLGVTQNLKERAVRSAWQRGERAGPPKTQGGMGKEVGYPSLMP
jgi:hypothetical protein